MKSLFLVIFCALGVGLAVAFALHSPALSESAFRPLADAATAASHGAGNASIAQQQTVGIVQTVAENLSPPRGQRAAAQQAVGNSNNLASAQLAALATASREPELRPAIAQRIDRLESQLEQAAESREQNERLLRNAVSTLQNATILQAAQLQNREQPPPPALVAPAVSEPSENEEPAPQPLKFLPSAGPLQEASLQGDTATADQPQEAKSLAEIRPGEGDEGLTINIQDSNIREVLDLLSAQGLNILASPNVQGVVSASLHNVTVEQALHAILKSAGLTARPEGQFIYVGTPKDFSLMDQSVDEIATRVYRPNYVTAAELQTLFTPLLTQGVGLASVSSPAEVGIPADNVQAGGDAFGGGEVVLVRDYRSVLNLLDDVVLEVDQRPLQVSIEAMIVSVELKNNNNRGVDFELLRNKQNARLISGSPLANLGAIDVTESGLKFGFLDTSLALFLEALETVGDTNVIASPRLLCLNKQRAEILIGAQLGYVSTTVTENAATQTVNFLEVGTQLRLRPFISRDGVIRLEIHPELSTGSVEVTGGFTLPNKSVTQVTTNVACQNGATVIIGGLIREDVSEDVRQIPLLGSLPLVGAAFRQTSEKITRTEIIVLLTPRIVGDGVAGHEGALAATTVRNRHEVRKDKMSPIGRRYYAKHYLRHAQAAWSANDADAALRYANLSIHFNPLDSDAVELRGLIMEVSGLGDATIQTHLREGLAPWAHPMRDYSKTNAVWDRPSAPFKFPFSPMHVDKAFDAFDNGTSGGLEELEPGAAVELPPAPVFANEPPNGVKKLGPPKVLGGDFSIGEPGPIRDLNRKRPR